MKYSKTFLMGVLVLGASVGLAISASAGERRYLVELKAGQSTAGMEAVVKAAGGQVTATLPQIGVVAAKSASLDFQKRVAAGSKVQAVVPDVMLNWLGGVESVVKTVGPADLPVPIVSDWYFPFQWGLTAINAPGAWAKGAKGDGAVVAVLDTGFVLDHPDLEGQWLSASKNFVDIPGEELEFNNTPYSFSHGTHTAGIVAARENNGEGVVGVAPQAKLLLCKVLTDAGSGYFEWLVEAMVYATEQDVDIISMSLSGAVPRHGFIDDGGTPDDPTDDVRINGSDVAELFNMVNRASQYAYQHGVTVFAAAANDALDRNHDADWLILPADCMNVLQISATGPVDWLPGSTDSDLDLPAFYSNYGSSRINFAAPGGNLDPSNPDQDYQWWWNLVLSCANNPNPNDPSPSWTWAGGTSMATPHAAGVAALIVGQRGHMSPAQLAAAMRAAADDLGKPGKDDYYGLGRVNAAKAIK